MASMRLAELQHEAKERRALADEAGARASKLHAVDQATIACYNIILISSTTTT